MLFWSFFKSLAEQTQSSGGAHPVRIIVELKSGVKVVGILEQVDESLNF